MAISELSETEVNRVETISKGGYYENLAQGDSIKTATGGRYWIEGGTVEVRDRLGGVLVVRKGQKLWDLYSFPPKVISTVVVDVTAVGVGVRVSVKDVGLGDVKKLSNDCVSYMRTV